MVISIALILMSCGGFGINPQSYAIMEDDLFTAWKQVAAHERIPEKPGQNYYKSPIEFEKDGGGDCEDFCIALMYRLGPGSRLICVRGDGEGHAIVGYKGLYIEPMHYDSYYMPDKLDIIEEYSYDETMRMATWYGMKGGLTTR